jgi:hypothetical protein
MTCRFQEPVSPNRGGNSAYKQVDAASDEGLERLFNRLKLNG